MGEEIDKAIDEAQATGYKSAVLRYAPEAAGWKKKSEEAFTFGLGVGAVSSGILIVAGIFLGQVIK